MSGGLPDLAWTTICCSKFLSPLALTVAPVQVVKSVQDFFTPSSSVPTMLV